MGCRSRLTVIALVGCAVLVGCGEREVVRPAKPVRCPAGVPHPDDGLPPIPEGKWDAREVLGLDEARATRLARRHRCELRATVRDGESEISTADKTNGRVNVRVDDGRVTRLLGVF